MKTRTGAKNIFTLVDEPLDYIKPISPDRVRKMSIHNRKAVLFARAAYLLALVMAVLLSPRPAAGAPDDTERDLRGFDSTMVRREKARRELLKGKSYLDDGSLDLARTAFNEALKLDENLHEARFCLGLAEYKDGKFKLAIAQFQSLYERHPDYKNLRLELARSYLAAGDCSEAKKWLERHLKKSKADKDTDKLKRDIDKCTKRREKKS